MTHVFQEAKFEWNGEQFSIPPTKTFGAIIVVEQHLTMIELNKMLKGGSFSMTKLAIAWSALLNYAGAKTTPEDVYLGMFDATDKQGRVIAAIQQLLILMVPKSTAPVGEQ